MEPYSANFEVTETRQAHGGGHHRRATQPLHVAFARQFLRLAGTYLFRSICEPSGTAKSGTLVFWRRDSGVLGGQLREHSVLQLGAFRFRQITRVVEHAADGTVGTQSTWTVL